MFYELPIGASNKKKKSSKQSTKNTLPTLIKSNNEGQQAKTIPTNNVQNEENYLS